MEPFVSKLRNKAEVTETELHIMQLKLEQIEEKFNKEANAEINITTLLASLQQLKSKNEHLKEEINSSRKQHEDVLAALSKNHRDLKECFADLIHTMSNLPTPHESKQNA